MSNTFPKYAHDPRTWSYEASDFICGVTAGTLDGVPFGGMRLGSAPGSFDDAALSTPLPLERDDPVAEFGWLAASAWGPALCLRVTTIFDNLR